MRTLTSTLLAEIRKSSYTQYVEINLIPLTGTTLTYKTTDATDRIISVVHNEARFAVGDTRFAAIIRLNNYDQHFKTKTLEGYKVKISNGAIVSGSPESSVAPPLWVVAQRDVSEQGRLITELGCVDTFQRLAFYRAMSGAVRLNANADFTAAFNHGEQVSGGGATGIMWVQGTDHMIIKNMSSHAFADGDTVTGDDSSASFVIDTNGVFNPGTGETPAWEEDTSITDITDELLKTCGLASADEGLTIDIAEPTSPDPPGNLQASQLYFVMAYNTDYLSALITLMANTKSGLRMRDGSYARGGMRILSIPASPQTQLVGTITGTFVLGELVTQANTSATGRVVYQNSTTYLVIEANTGTFNTSDSVTGATASMTPSSINPQDYEYEIAGDHPFWSNIRDRHLVVPQQLLFVDDPLNPSFQASAIIQGSVDAFGGANKAVGVVFAATDPDEIKSDQDAQDMADTLKHQLLQEKNTGAITVPMNPAAELWDVAGITDTRSGQTAFTDRVQGLTRTYVSDFAGQGGRYELELRFGSLVSRYKTSFELEPQPKGEPSEFFLNLQKQLVVMQASLTEFQDAVKTQNEIIAALNEALAGAGLVTTPSQFKNAGMLPGAGDEPPITTVPATGPLRTGWERDFDIDQPQTIPFPTPTPAPTPAPGIPAEGVERDEWEADF